MAAVLDRAPAAVAAGRARGLRRRSPRSGGLLAAMVEHSVAIVLATAFLGPFVIVLLTALMSDGQALSGQLWPHPFRWSNFGEVLARDNIL